MGNFNGGGNRDNRGGGFGGGRGGDRGGRPSFGGGGKPWEKRGGNDRGEVTMHKAVCNECGKSCEVPFRPSSDKPVYCNECFGSKREGVDRKPRNDSSFSRPSFDRPTSRPEASRPMTSNDDTKKQFIEIINRLDRLTQLLENNSKKEVVKTTAPVAKVEVKKAPTVVAKKVEVKKVAMPAKKVEVKAVVKKAAPAKKVVAKKKK